MYQELHLQLFHTFLRDVVIHYPRTQNFGKICSLFSFCFLFFMKLLRNINHEKTERWSVHVMFVNEHHANVGKFSEKMSVFWRYSADSGNAVIAKVLLRPFSSQICLYVLAFSYNFRDERLFVSREQRRPPAVNFEKKNEKSNLVWILLKNLMAFLWFGVSL